MTKEKTDVLNMARKKGLIGKKFTKGELLCMHKYIVEANKVLEAIRAVGTAPKQIA